MVGVPFVLSYVSTTNGLVPVLVVAHHDAVHVAVPHRLQQIPRLPIDVDRLLLQGAHLGDEVQPTLALLLLELERDVPHGPLGDALHEVGRESGDLVPHPLGGGDGDLVDDALVGVEVEGEAGVVLLDDGPGGLLDGLGADSLNKRRGRCVRQTLFGRRDLRPMRGGGDQFDGRLDGDAPESGERELDQHISCHFEPIIVMGRPLSQTSACSRSESRALAA